MKSELVKKLADFKSSLPVLILEDHFLLRPDMAEFYSEYQKENFKKDVAWILSFLSEAVWAEQPILFDEFVSWLKYFLMSVKVPMKDLAESIELIRKRLNSLCLPAENEVINPILKRAVDIVLSEDELISILTIENHLSPFAQKYLDNLLQGKRNLALSQVLDKVKTSADVKEMYLEVFQPVQYEIGRLWQTNKISVAQEHYCTGATQLIMSQLYPYLFTGTKKNRKMVTTCVSGELHEVGARMVTDFFEMEGWDTYYLGANMPIDGLINFLSDNKPQCLAISATMTFHVSTVEDMIRKIKQSNKVDPNLKIIVGGYPFKVAQRLWKQIGADGFAVGAEEAVELANQLITESI